MKLYSGCVDEDFVSNKTYFLTFHPDNASLPFPVTIIDDKMAENTEQFGLVMSVANSLASNGKNKTATVFIIDSTGKRNTHFQAREVNIVLY